MILNQFEFIIAACLRDSKKKHAGKEKTPKKKSSYFDDSSEVSPGSTSLVTKQKNKKNIEKSKDIKKEKSSNKK